MFGRRKRSDFEGSIVELALLAPWIVQPRGAWYNIYPGTSGIGASPLQILTGQLTCTAGCGNTHVTLLPATDPIITYLPALIR